MPSLTDAHQALLGSDDLQFDFGTAPAAPRDSDFAIDLIRVLRSQGMLIAAGLVAAIVLVLLVRRWWLRRPMRQAEPWQVAAGGLIPVAAARSALEEADIFAAAGRFGEAAHALLACGVGEIGRRFPGTLRPATTSRDLAADARLPEGIRKAFSPIAATVEAGRFADRPTSSSDYALCRQAFVASTLAGQP